MKNERYSRSEIERALRAADYPEDSMGTDEDHVRYAGRAEAVEIVRDMLGMDDHDDDLPGMWERADFTGGRDD